ncbi:ribosomal protein S18-alanine N-acetyltransferase [Halomonas pacifica]|uniref:Ribosomal protein S18-alanine N-acetyltransferase n=2 Tax=Bisbaumannia pacifica TaxID=77098 RepID=A0ABD4L7T9_9GAMM|nr:ribosomal protein S18-alanine N-acetyltransferase [Halomonas pacifica]MBH8581751.1 ribosomal protein S18-alanine N-acetyltransferase [Halomonas pacifica]
MAMPELVRLVGGDLPDLLALERAGQPHPWSERQLADALEDEAARVRGVRDGETLLGQAIVYRLPFEAELQAITVSPRARRRGLARLLLESVVETARGWGSERLLLEVRAGNAPALALYRAAGFTEDGRRRGYYPGVAGAPREDAVLMSLALAPPAEMA